eukprot:scaffold1110_cov399-Pavlova_lutheri.AAC.10
MFRRKRWEKREPWRVAEDCGRLGWRLPAHGRRSVPSGACPYFIPRRGYPHAVVQTPLRWGVFLDDKCFYSPIEMAAHSIHPSFPLPPSPPRFFFIPSSPLTVSLWCIPIHPPSPNLDGVGEGTTDPPSGK